MGNGYNIMQIINKTDDVQTLWWMVKFTFVVSMVLLISNLATVSVVYYLLPLKEVKPYLLSIHPQSEQIVKIEAVQKSVSGYSLLMEQLARRYVMLREVIDLQTEFDRWTEIYLMTDEKNYRSFENTMRLENKESPLLKFQERQIKREVHILSSNNLAPTAPDIWQVEWEAIDNDAKTQITVNRQIFISTITAETRQQNIQLDSSLINPTGFTVINYSIALKRRKEDFNEIT